MGSRPGRTTKILKEKVIIEEKIENTARRYLDILAGAYMIRVLPPWFENTCKRQVKAPKVYIRDSGILHALLQLQTLTDLQGHPKLGSSCEGFAVEQIICALETRDTYFWATHAGPESDLLVMAQGKRINRGLEAAFRSRSTPDGPNRRSLKMLI